MLLLVVPFLLGGVFFKYGPIPMIADTSSRAKQASSDIGQSLYKLKEEDRRAWEPSRLTEGDIEYHKVVEDQSLGTRSRYWPDAVVPYYFDDDFGDDQEIILGAMKAIEEVTCVRFLECKNCDKDHVALTRDKNRCSSPVGRVTGGQRLFLGEKCNKHGVILHELLHTLGLHHIHMSPNRDEYITVHWENIKPEHLFDFKKLNTSVMEDFGVGYDYESIMHYKRRSFSQNGKATITPKKKTAKIGQRERLSEGDITKLNRMYNCQK